MSIEAGARDRALKPGSWRPLAPLAIAFTAIAMGFVTSTLYAEKHASQIDGEARLIETNSLPSVEMLVAAESSLRHVELATHELAAGTGAAQREAQLALDAARADLEREVTAEGLTGMYPGEADLSAVAARALRDLDTQLARFVDLAARDPLAARALSEHEVHGAVERTHAALDSLLALNAGEARAEAIRIAHVRAGSLHLAFGLDAMCLLLSAAAAFLALRALRTQQKAERAHEAILEAQAEELEMFAKRVAHDLLSPLSALSFTLSAIKRNTARKLPIDEPLQRSMACLKRSQRLVDGVLDFARSAARPSLEERASLRDAIDGVLDEAHPDEVAEAGDVEISVVPWEGDVLVACSPGILTSVLANLVQNAVKYIGEPTRSGAPRANAERRVSIRVMARPADVEVEVADTGPGLPPGLESRIFEPYYRAPNSTQPGLGLGLATVRRFVDAHHGTVAVRPAPEGGSIFSFRLPRVAAVVVAAERAIPFRNGVTSR